MDRIQKHITLHFSLLILHPPFFTLNPTRSILQSASFNFQPYNTIVNRGRSLFLRNPPCLIVLKTIEFKYLNENTLFACNLFRTVNLFVAIEITALVQYVPFILFDEYLSPCL